MCGEPCPKKCRVCHEAEVTEIFFGTEDEDDAMFIELADCGHVFEVEMMDQWMDQAEVKDEGKSVDIQLKKCPKCQVPIRTSLRYGNIVKKLLADMETVKKKIFLSESALREKVPNIRKDARELTEFPEDVEEIQRSLVGRKYLTSDQLNVLENQVQFLKFLQKLQSKIRTELATEKIKTTTAGGVLIGSDRFSRLSSLMEHRREHEVSATEQMKMARTRKHLHCEVESLRKWVMKFRVRFSDQELEEFNEELLRVLLLVSYEILKTQLDLKRIDIGTTDTQKMNAIEDALANGKPIGM